MVLTDFYTFFFVVFLSLFRFANSLPMNDPLQTIYQLMSGRMPASATVSFASAFCPSFTYSFCRNYILGGQYNVSLLLSQLSYMLHTRSAVVRRSGVTGALTWPWCCQTSHTPWTLILAQSPPWETLSVGLCQKSPI